MTDAYAADRAGAVAVKMAAVAGILTKPEIGAADRNELAHHLTYMRNSLKFLDFEMQEAVVTVTRAAAVRMAQVAAGTVERAEVKAFGNSGHIIVPNNMVGRRVVYAVLPEESD